MTTYSANLGFLYTDLALPDAVRAAADDGFAAVECHWPYATPPDMMRQALHDTALPMLGLNTSRGGDREFGLAAVPGREAQARQTIDEAVAYGAAIDARAVHVMAGTAQGPAAHDCFVTNLEYACDRAAEVGMRIVIEPLNRFDNPGYFLADTGQAAGIIAEVGRANLALMFDCYHVARTEGDVAERFGALLPLIGHVQFAGVPDRGEPDRGDVDYRAVFSAIAAAGWTQPLGAEYRPSGRTGDALEWMHTLAP